MFLSLMVCLLNLEFHQCNCYHLSTYVAYMGVIGVWVRNRQGYWVKGKSLLLEGGANPCSRSLDSKNAPIGCDNAA